MFALLVQYKDMRTAQVHSSLKTDKNPFLTMLGEFLGSVGVDNGEGNSTCIYDSCDDHDTYGVMGPGDYGPGNGEPMGDLWSP